MWGQCGPRLVTDFIQITHERKSNCPYNLGKADKRGTYISSVRATKTSGASPDKRRKYDAAFKTEALRLAGESRGTQAAARQLGINPKLLYRWQQAQLVAEVGSEEVARDPEVRALRARLKRAEQELDMLKKALASKGCSRLISQPTR